MGRGIRAKNAGLAVQARIGVRRGKNFEIIEDSQKKKDLEALRNFQSYAWMPADRFIITKAQKKYIDEAMHPNDADKLANLTEKQKLRFYNAHAAQFDEKNEIPGGSSMLQERIHPGLLDQVQLPEQYPEEFNILKSEQQTPIPTESKSLRPETKRSTQEDKEKVAAIAEILPLVPGQSNKKTLKQAATSAHKEWQKNWQSQNGDEPRWKDTKDEKWISKHGTDKVDIAHTDFNQLPKDWQKDNVLGANSAMKAVQEQIAEQLKESVDYNNGVIRTGPEVFSKENIDKCSIDIEKASAKVHDAWVKRNGAQDWVKETGLDKPYAELPEDEKEKDRAFVKLVISLMGR